ncbi:MAG TPA: 2-C-methyl-D-erythritol 2,4-cyclodiphosphate synthase [Terriglobia bacterium]|nr:2-C-methyl-D-erythritol 2,4-cyclodiphosphate synthase [Terriglobia bacterium]
MNFRVGLGFDLHRLGPGSHLMLGGVEIPYSKGFIAHSDGDVLCHAMVDALLGAAGLGNIGERFPDTDPKYKGMASLKFLTVAANLLRGNGFQIENIDSNILADQPKLHPHFPLMRDRISVAVGIPSDKVSIKAKTMEGIGMIGSDEAIAAQVVALISLR